LSQVGAAPSAPPDAPTADPHPYRYPVVAFVVVGLVLLVWVGLSQNVGPQHPDYPRPATFTGIRALEGWVRFDGNWYRTIAADGYSYNDDIASTVAFFPSYPMAMALATYVIRDVVLAGIFVTAVSGLGATVLFYRWCSTRMSLAAARAATLALLLFPYAWYLFGAVYADALFLVAVLGAFVLVEKDHPVWAGLAGAVATGCRPVGLAVVLGLVLRTLERRGALRLGFLERLGVSDRPAVEPPHPSDPPDRSDPATGRRRLVAVDLRALRPGDAGVLLSVGGLVGWSLYLWHRFGEPMLFVDVQRLPPWSQEPGPRTWFKLEFFDSLRYHWDWAYNYGLIFQAILALSALLLVLPAARRYGWAYAAYVVAVIGIPLVGSKDFQGMGRYLLAAFPLFAVGGELLAARPAAKVWVLGASSVALAVLSSLYARGWYVA
jgi:hypothetical protein